jgi:peptide/nickel transport system permease protein
MTHPALLVGLLVILFLLTAVMVPGMMAPYGPNERGSVLQMINGQWHAPPYAPGGWYLLGTDPQARDLLSRIIYGARVTLGIALCVTMLRIGIGASLGLLADRYPGEIRRYCLILAGTSATVPSLLFAYLVIATIGPNRGLAVFIIALSLTGWAPWTQLVYDGMQRIRRETYMEAALAVGSTTRSQLRYYFLPNLLPMLIPAGAQELAAGLLVLAELGFLGVFLGMDHTMSLADLLGGEQPDLSYPEWAGMLAGTRLEIFNHWWLPIVPAGAFALVILGLNLFSDGLREALVTRGRQDRH